MDAALQPGSTMEEDSCAPTATEVADNLSDSAEVDKKAMQSVIGERDMVTKIIGMTGEVATLMAAQAVCKTWLEFIGQTDEVWKDLTYTRFPRARLSIAEGMDWGAPNVTWKDRFFKLERMKPAILWVDDKPEVPNPTTLRTRYTILALTLREQNVEHLISRIQEDQKNVVFHKGSTREARSWLTSDIAALCPTLKVITDNHRDELDEAGELQSNFDAGTQLIEWLNVQSESFDDTQILMFCGAGSLPYVRALKTKYDNVEITVNEGSLLKWVRGE